MYASGSVPWGPLRKCGGGRIQGVQRRGSVWGQRANGYDHLILCILSISQPATHQNWLETLINSDSFTLNE